MASVVQAVRGSTGKMDLEVDHAGDAVRQSHRRTAEGGAGCVRLAEVVAVVGARPVDGWTADMDEVRALVAFAIAQLPADHPLRRFDDRGPAVVVMRVLGRLASAMPELLVPQGLARPFTRSLTSGGRDAAAPPRIGASD